MNFNEALEILKRWHCDISPLSVSVTTEALMVSFDCIISALSTSGVELADVEGSRKNVFAVVSLSRVKEFCPITAEHDDSFKFSSGVGFVTSTGDNIRIVPYRKASNQVH